MILERMVELRHKFDMTQEQLADYLGVSRTAYAMYEQGHRQMEYKTIVKLADRYKVSLDYLFGRSDNPLHPDVFSADEIEFLVKSLDLYLTLKGKIIKEHTQ